MLQITFNEQNTKISLNWFSTQISTRWTGSSNAHPEIGILQFSRSFQGLIYLQLPQQWRIST